MQPHSPWLYTPRVIPGTLTDTPLSDPAAQRRLAALYDLATELAALRDLQGVLDTALQHCLKLTDSQFGFIGLTSVERDALDIVAIHGFHPAADFYQRFRVIPLRPNIFSRVVLEDRPVRSEDAMADPGRVGQPGGHPPTHTFLGVPLRTGDMTIGMIGVANRATSYADEHEDLLAAYAAQVAVAIANARLNEELAVAKTDLERRVAERTQQLTDAKEALADKAHQLRQLLADTVHVQELERQRIAHDLHDGPSQLLVGAMLEMKSASERLNRGDAIAAQLAVTQSLSILHRLEREMRQAIFALRPPILDELGLVPSMRRCAEAFAEQSRLAVDFEVQGNPYRLEANGEICVYRILQEALNNIHSHARANTVRVALHFDAHMLFMQISDDGQGFNPQAIRAGGERFGLLGMRERAEMIGGKLSIVSSTDIGSTIQLWLPIT